MNWERLAIGGAVAIVVAIVAVAIWFRRSALSREEALACARYLGGELVRLPGRLRRVAADPRTPRRARWWLIGLAIYVASPIDLIPDFIPLPFRPRTRKGIAKAEIVRVDEFWNHAGFDRLFGGACRQGFDR